MIIALKTFKARITKYGKDNYRYIGRTMSNDGLHSYAIIDDLHAHDTIHVEEDDDIIESLCGECEY